MRYSNPERGKTIQLNIFSSFRLILIASLFSLTVSACKDEVEEDVQPTPVIPTSNENSYVNDWILENMQYWYLWNTEIPSKTDKTLAPDAYFESLLADDDRFSWIQDNYQELLNSLEGINKEAGFEYVLYRDSNTDANVIAQILYVKPNSPAETAGLKRGDIITKINSTTITTSNYKTLVPELKENHTLTYKPLNVAEEKFGEEISVSLNTVEYSENPHYLFKVIPVNDKKIGYYVYNFFASGTSTDEDKYDLEMENIFNVFKGQNITDLVLDLRFNSGGSELAAKNLASFVGADVTESKVFMKRHYNEDVQKYIVEEPSLGESFLTSKFLAKSANVGSGLSGKRVYILTSSRTASASELIINSLKPYMDVFLIGDVTYGKNVGSISLYEENDAKNKWGLQPIVVKVENSVGFSDYGAGFTPNVLNKDNDLYLYPLGDKNETLLAEAIAQITGEASTGRVAAKSAPREILGHSLDEKRRSFKLIMDETDINIQRP